MKKLQKTALLLSVAVIVISFGSVGISTSAQTNTRAANIKSKGNIDYNNGSVVICSEDLSYLADEIDMLEYTYKAETLNALGKVGTYFRADGTATHNKEDGTIEPSEACMLPFGTLTDGIMNSQNIPAQLEYAGTPPGADEEITGNITAAAADNLSMGTAAWVEGKLIIGTGTDNNNSYMEGVKSGYDKGYAEGAKSAEVYTETASYNNTLYMLRDFTIFFSTCGIDTDNYRVIGAALKSITISNPLDGNTSESYGTLSSSVSSELRNDGLGIDVHIDLSKSAIFNEPTTISAAVNIYYTLK